MSPAAKARAPVLTKAQRKELDRAVMNGYGVVEPFPTWGGLQRASWHARMSALVSRGLLKPYPHGGYEITDIGRAAISKVQGKADA